MNYKSVLVAVLGCFAFAACVQSQAVGRQDPAWCQGYAKYCSYHSIKSQCLKLCNVTEIVDPSWCLDYKAFCANNPSIRQQCPRTCVVAINGGWGKWSDWSACSVTCGKGAQNRLRSCDHPKPSNGGLVCKMKVGTGHTETEVKDCSGKEECPRHGGYSEWSPFTKCTKKCGAGVQYRNRCCVKPFPGNGGNDCSKIGPPVEARVCNVMPCPIHGNYSKWGDYGACSAKCGGGMQKRIRLCSAPIPQFGGKNCSHMGPAAESKPCNPQPCPIDGNYTKWSHYSKCTKSCGGGLQYRSRCCVNPMPKFGGKSCAALGEPVDVKVCHVQPCPIDGGWSVWGAFGICTQKCGTEGVKMRKRECENPKPLFNGKDCPGLAFESSPCNRVACAVDGGFGEWTAWGACSVTCNQGVRNSTRKCDKPAPIGGGKPCNGSIIKTLPCAQKPCPVDGVWAAWEAFGQCSAQCGDKGVKLRKRKCIPPMFNGKDCPGLGIESAACNRVPCKVDGGFSVWSAWTTCSATCGKGSALRFRKCDKPTPQHGGKACVGTNDEKKDCQVVKCSEYKYGLELKSWDDAEKACVAWAGHLATVTDQKEMDLIIAGFSGLGVSLTSDNYAWIGLQDRVVTSKWQWISGEKTTAYAPWGNGEPSHTTHNCVSINLMFKSWWDRNCPDTYRYVCEK